MYGTDPHRSPDCGRIVNEPHAERIAAMLQGANVAIGGDFDVADRYVAPTVLVDVQLDDKVMADEIFGPVHANRRRRQPRRSDRHRQRPRQAIGPVCVHQPT